MKIWNEFFRDENVDNKATLRTDDSNTFYETGATSEETATVEKRLAMAYKGGYCLPVNKMHDYFTSCLPYPQRGPEINLPMTGNAKIHTYSNSNLNDSDMTSMYISSYTKPIVLYVYSETSFKPFLIFLHL